jgi:hypothetical protein
MEKKCTGPNVVSESFGEVVVLLALIESIPFLLFLLKENRMP